MKPRPLSIVRASRSTRQRALVDRLEGRQLLSGTRFDSLNVNFQSPDTDVPAGFRADGGVEYGRRSNGFTYGWSENITGAAYNRDNSKSPDESFDTGIATQANGTNSTWQVAVSSGRYRVTAVAGDPWVQPSMLGYTIEGRQAFVVAQKGSKPWVSGTLEVDVTDGKLTIGNAFGAFNNRLAFVNIVKLGSGTTTAASSVAAGTVTLPGKVEVENFKPDGGKRTTTYDTSRGNAGNAYRTDSDVDLYGSGDAGGGYAIGKTQAGEWLTYSVKVPESGLYNIDFRVRSGSAGGTMHLEFNGSDRTGPVMLPSTGSWTNWTTVTKTSAWLSAGTATMKLKFDKAKVAGSDIGDVNWIQISRVGTANPAPTTGTSLAWQAKASIPMGRYEAASATVNGKLYAFGGYMNTEIEGTKRVDVYDPAMNVWKKLKDMPESLTHVGLAVEGPYVYLVGGFVGDHPGEGTTSFWKYDTRNDTWSRGPAALPAARGAGGLALVGRTLYWVSGLARAENVTKNETEMWSLDLSSSGPKWQSRPAIPVGRNHFATVVLNNKIYVIGGQNLWEEFTGNSARVDIFDPAKNSWSRGVDLPKPRGHTMASAMVYNGKIYLVGGNTNGTIKGVQTVLADVTRFDPATGKWTELTALPAKRMSGIGGIIGNRIYFTGGNSELLKVHASTWSAAIG